MANENLHAAKAAKNDEFYTRLEDIEQELYWYREQFKGKKIFCNCDDSWSNFYKYFHLCYNFLELKGLVCTHYDPEKVSYAYIYHGEDDDDINVCTKVPLTGNGDFRNKECLDLLDECDIVVTNPPFSLFREFVATLEEHQKKYLLLGNMNAVTYKEIFPLIKNGKMWAGYSFNKTMDFIMPDNYEIKGKGYIDENGRKHGFVPAICWFTNLDVQKRHERLSTESVYSAEKYPRYDNYDAIEVDKVVRIPGDYDGVMGVPITFLDKYCPDQFEILGLDRYTAPKEALIGGRVAINGKPCYARILIKKKQEVTNDNNRNESKD